MIDAQVVIAIHDAILATEPGLHGGYGQGPLEGALGRVANATEYDGLDDIYEISALYAVALARGHVFNDANKRTALVTALTYLATQGVDIERSPELEDIMVDVAEGYLNHVDLATILFSIAPECYDPAPSTDTFDMNDSGFAELVKTDPEFAHMLATGWAQLSEIGKDRFLEVAKRLSLLAKGQN
ncbi:type II toxin-antitoxin system death-on-curing family toxin (plasmid) [Pseudoduganella sp. UC29_106]|uniref:type II toxin-antitoxin system death-on-curing family toxin n=1 Tax=Pseudoduganella sp. UC29_106 TaxID=3374553 RepID=UPI003756A8BC